MTMISGLLHKLFGGGRQPGEPVADILTRLPEDYQVFNGLLYDANEIEYVLFHNRKGLFIITLRKDRSEVTSKGSRLHINRKPVNDPIKKALSHAFWLKSAIREKIGIDVPVTSMVVFENARVRDVAPILGVRVIASDGLLAAIDEIPAQAVLPDGVVMALRDLHGVNTINNRTL